MTAKSESKMVIKVLLNKEADRTI